MTLAKGLSRAGMAVAAVLHGPNMAFRYGDDFLFAGNGSVRRAGEGKPPWDPSLLSGVYGIPLQVTEAEGNRFVIPMAEKANG